MHSLTTKLRTIFRYAVLEGIIPSSPFAKITLKAESYGTPYYITIEERNAIYQYPMDSHPQLAIQRDIFVFHCLIGCRVSDLLQLSKKSLIGGTIEYIPRKTKEGRPVTIRVPLNSIAQEIVAKYSDHPEGQLLPFISSQKYNDAIKRIFTIAGINRVITVVNPTTGEEEQRPINELASSHLARRTFIGNIYKQVKDPNLVGSLSGHKEGSRAFARYREIDDDMKRDLVNLLE